MTQAAQREQVHRLIDVVSPEQLTALSALLEVMVDPSTRKFATAPLEDERISPEEDAQAAAASGPLFSVGDVMEEMGISRADLERQRLDDEAESRS